jgi:predicted DNA-binding protein
VETPKVEYVLIQTRVVPEAYTRLGELADQEGQTMAGYLRGVIMQIIADDGKRTLATRVRAIEVALVNWGIVPEGVEQPSGPEVPPSVEEPSSLDLTEAKGIGHASPSR